MTDLDDFFLAEDVALAVEDTRKPWTILITDDEPDVHTATTLALRDIVVQDRPLQFISAYSGLEAAKLVETGAEIDLMLLDSVMEAEDAGINCAKYIKEVLGMSIPVIVMRTGWAPSENFLASGSKYLDDFVYKVEATQPVLVALLKKWLK